MANTSHFSFSSPGFYSLKFFGELSLLNSQWLNTNRLKVLNKESNGFIYLLHESFKDQAHLLGFIEKLNEHHFTIISINKINKPSKKTRQELI